MTKHQKIVARIVREGVENTAGLPYEREVSERGALWRFAANYAIESGVRDRDAFYVACGFNPIKGR